MEDFPWDVTIPLGLVGMLFMAGVGMAYSTYKRMQFSKRLLSGEGHEAEAMIASLYKTGGGEHKNHLVDYEFTAEREDASSCIVIVKGRPVESGTWLNLKENEAETVVYMPEHPATCRLKSAAGSDVCPCCGICSPTIMLVMASFMAVMTLYGATSLRNISLGVASFILGILLEAGLLRLIFGDITNFRTPGGDVTLQDIDEMESATESE